MKRDDIIRMAREAGLFVPHAGISENGGLTRFAALVAEQERQRCADIADSHASIEGIAQRIAAEIRSQS